MAADRGSDRLYNGIRIGTRFLTPNLDPSNSSFSNGLSSAATETSAAVLPVTRHPNHRPSESYATELAADGLLWSHFQCCDRDP